MSGRRPKVARRRPRHDAPDDDLAELAAVISEHRLENNARGWFEMPWVSGWNAAELAYAGWSVETMRWDGVSRGTDDALRIATRTCELLVDQDPKSYSDADEVLDVASELIVLKGRDDVRFLTAALRCMQVEISNSSGGGTVFNGILARVFERGDPARFADAVMHARCVDAIGTRLEFQADGRDRLRRAFKTAWERGLYRAAYALPRAA